MNMRKLAIAAGTILTAVAATASAQYYNDRGNYRTYDRDDYRRTADTECWNPRAGHFEQVRPGESQGDLDFGRCRATGTGERLLDRRQYRDNRNQECWNPRARHYEEVRSGEQQDDLDFSRCRIARN
jgi:hypothetical protein